MKLAHGNRHPTPRSGGFTLLEVLVVIGLIVLLIGILIPVASKVRTASQAANTRQMLARLEAGINQYGVDFGVYPGPFANVQIGSRPQLLPGPSNLRYFYNLVDSPDAGLLEDTSRVNVTSTENLFLGLVGGLTISPDFRVSFEYAGVPSGPQSLNPAVVKRFGTYIAVDPAETTSITAPRFFSTNAPGYGGSDDTRIPEVLDKFGSPMPILYLRAMRGTNGIVSSTDLQQYNRAHLEPYGFPANNDAEYLSNFPAFPSQTVPSPSPARLTAGDQAYFGNDATATNANGVADDSPLQKDGFVLISAGPDGKYGTSDDITNFRNR